MEFSFINIFAMMIDTLIIIPEMLHALRGIQNDSHVSKKIKVLIYVFKYASLILMFVPLGVNKFGFASVFHMLVYLISNCVLIIAYIVIFIINLRKRLVRLELVLLYIVTAIYVISGLVLGHYLLVICALIYFYLQRKAILS